MIARLVRAVLRVFTLSACPPLPPACPPPRRGLSVDLLEIGEQLSRVAVAVVRVLRETFHDHALEALRQDGPLLPQRGRSGLHVHPRQLEPVRGGKRYLPGRRLEEGDAQGVVIDALVER